MTIKNIRDKKIVISAAADGIGWHITETCLAEGAKVFLCDINLKFLEKIYSHPLYKKKLFACKVDVASEIEVINFFKEIKKKFTKIDVIINNVGIAGPTGQLEKLNSKDWEKTIHINLNSHFYFLKQSIPLIKKSKKGSIINLSSTAGIYGFPLRSPYAASKWAIIGLTKTLAMELGKFKIRVNAICPGTIKGDRMNRVISAKAKFLKVPKKFVEKEYISMTSMNTWIYEEDIAKTCGYLISDDALRVSGQVISIDGNTFRMD